MKKLFAFLSVIIIIVLLTSCSNNQINPPAQETNAVSEAIPTSTEPKLPYWDTNSIGSYAGLINGQRFSGDFTDVHNYENKDGDSVIVALLLKGYLENKESPDSAESHNATNPLTMYAYFDAKEKTYTGAWDLGVADDDNGYYLFDCKKYDVFYSQDSCVIESPSYDIRIEADDDYVVYSETDDDGYYKRVFWKKDAGLLGYCIHRPKNEYQEALTENIRFTSKTDGGWNMAETIVPKSDVNSERKWPEKLWPVEYNGLDDPELRAILEEY